MATQRQMRKVIASQKERIAKLEASRAKITGWLCKISKELSVMRRMRDKQKPKQKAIKDIKAKKHRPKKAIKPAINGTVPAANY